MATATHTVKEASLVEDDERWTVKRQEAATRETTPLCGQPWRPDDSKSPRCLVAKTAHAGRPHQAIRVDGRVLEWPVEPDQTT
jgi:hypothetical protein